MPFTFTPLAALPDVVLVQSRLFGDERGWFIEAWKDSDFRVHGIGPFVQDNHSGNVAAGILRGLHYQLPPQAQGKLVRCTRGRVWDVAVDLRPGPTRLRHAAVELAAGDAKMLWIPPGFAHGYLTLEEGSELAYKTTAEYAPALDRSLRWDDPQLSIPWPLRGAPQLAPKDAQAPLLKDAQLPARWA
ncbi:MAG TPA: dTDP-4-dehydrorhamnose 3,5-epimerase [Candidatus Thermoplasmatota archaeon]|nr:dTDP-4-dehydrorhamnose 3,5-epimerase [Candidatus Thermoplasmatota archaeon]